MTKRPPASDQKRWPWEERAAAKPDPLRRLPAVAEESRFIKALLAIGPSTILVAIAVGIITAVFDLRSDLNMVALATLFTAGGGWAYILFPAICR